METLKECLTVVDQKDRLGAVFLGPAHEVDDPKSFPSASSIINESSDQTGVRIRSGHESAFDVGWFQNMRKDFDESDVPHELDEYLKTGLSNGRKLRLQVMVIPAGMYFKIHAHPNIEFVRVLKGSFQEFRWAFRVPSEKLTGDCPTGPEIAATQLFEHHEVEAGCCMVNEIGIVHQSFTSKEGGCSMLILWSGCHAYTHPSSVKNTDDRLRPSAGWE